MGRILSIMMLVAACWLVSAPADAADQALIDAAKKEGKVVWYTTQQIDPLVRPIVAAFEKKYGIHVDFVRTDSSGVALRIFNEGNAHRMQSDIFDGTAAVAELKKDNMVVQWLPDDAKRLPKDYYDAQGYWVADNIYVVTAGYNAQLVTPGSEPKNWQDLLDPKWQGKMLWSSDLSSSAGPGFVGLILKQMGHDKGMEYLHALARQNVANAPVSAREILNQVIAQEYPIGLQIFNHAVVLSAQQGAPVKWIPMPYVLVNFNVLALTAGGPHPNAGKLLEDYLISPEGQAFYRDAAMLPVAPEVAPLDPSLRPDGKIFSAVTMTPEYIDDNLKSWNQIFNQIFG